MSCVKPILNVLSATFALAAGGLWLWSTVATTTAEPPGESSFSAPMITEKGKSWNFLGTLHLQSKISAAAAVAASISAFFQAISLLLPETT
jgi:hypothetical protein